MYGFWLGWLTNTEPDCRDELEALFSELYNVFLKRATGILGSVVDAEDAIQDTMVKLFCENNLYKLYKTDHSERIRYISKAITNTALTKRRKRACMEVELVEAELSAVSSPEEDILRKETSREIQNAIREMPEPYRSLLRLYWHHPDLTHVQAAAYLNISRKTEARRYNRARNILKKALEQRGILIR